MRVKLMIGVVMLGVLAVAALTSPDAWVTDWQRTIGIVTYADFRREQPGGKLSAWGYRPYISYTYSVGGRAFEETAPSPDFLDEGALEAARQQYRPGSSVTVYYAADRPEISGLDPNRLGSGSAIGLFAAGAAIIGAVILGTTFLKDRRRRRFAG